jgi:hypothetical protein
VAASAGLAASGMLATVGSSCVASSSLDSEPLVFQTLDSLSFVATRSNKRSEDMRITSPQTFGLGFIVFNMLKLQMVIGEYAGDYGFSLPKPVSIHPEYVRSGFDIEWCM